MRNKFIKYATPHTYASHTCLSQVVRAIPSNFPYNFSSSWVSQSSATFNLLDLVGKMPHIWYSMQKTWIKTKHKKASINFYEHFTFHAENGNNLHFIRSLFDVLVYSFYFRSFLFSKHFLISVSNLYVFTVSACIYILFSCCGNGFGETNKKNVFCSCENREFRFFSNSF